MTREKGCMDMGLFKKIIDEYASFDPLPEADHGGSIWLHLFGESLLAPGFDEAIYYASQKGLKPMLSINPCALTAEKMRRLLDAKPHLLYLMVDGCDEESFSRLRGVQGLYNKTVENTLVLLKLKVELNLNVRTYDRMAMHNSLGVCLRHMGRDSRAMLPRF